MPPSGCGFRFCERSRGGASNGLVWRPSALAGRPLLVPDEAWVSEQLQRLSNIGGRAIGMSNPEYPQILCETVDAPPVLFGLGGAPWTAPCIAIVGSRRATDYGRRVARDLGAELAARHMKACQRKT
jgi:predicted Rossmann fold nucleotide-binding protein DprA/Smf involved in DNA uptake